MLRQATPPRSTDAPQFDPFEEERGLTGILCDVSMTECRRRGERERLAFEPRLGSGPVGRRMRFVLIAMRRLHADEIGDYSGWSLPSGHRFSVDAPEDGIVGAHRVMGLIF